MKDFHNIYQKFEFRYLHGGTEVAFSCVRVEKYVSAREIVTLVLLYRHHKVKFPIERLEKNVHVPQEKQRFQLV